VVLLLLVVQVVVLVVVLVVLLLLAHQGKVTQAEMAQLIQLHTLLLVAVAVLVE
jgi:hypothetical protein